MLNIKLPDNDVGEPPRHATLWRCDRCNSFVTIHSGLLIRTEVLCPACGEALLEFCGRFTTVPGLSFADA